MTYALIYMAASIVVSLLAGAVIKAGGSGK